MATEGGNSSKKRRRLTVAERYQVFLDVVSGAGSQRDVADKWRIDRTTVAHVCKVAKQGALDHHGLLGHGQIHRHDRQLTTHHRLQPSKLLVTTTIPTTQTGPTGTVTHGVLLQGWFLDRPTP